MKSEHRDPSIEEIDRAYQRPLPAYSDTSYVRGIWRNHRSTRKGIKRVAIILAVFASAFLGVATIDVVFHLGWGFRPKDLLGGLAFLALVFPITLLQYIILDLIGFLLRRQHGPEDPPSVPYGSND